MVDSIVSSDRTAETITLRVEGVILVALLIGWKRLRRYERRRDGLKRESERIEIVKEKRQNPSDVGGEADGEEVDDQDIKEDTKPKPSSPAQESERRVCDKPFLQKQKEQRSDRVEVWRSLPRLCRSSRLSEVARTESESEVRD